MTDLLQQLPYGPRNEGLLLGELNTLSRHHWEGCPEYRQVWPHWTEAKNTAELPWLHVGLFKHIQLRTLFEGVRYERILKSSATTSGTPSLIALDQLSSERQSRSTLAILREFVGTQIRPLLILDSAKSLRVRGEISARVAAALSLKSLSSEIHFMLDDPGDSRSMRWDRLLEVLQQFDDLLVYGFTWILWLVWGGAALPDNIRRALKGKRICFVHSGGWKKLEGVRVGWRSFDQSLLEGLHPNSKVIDYYGLVEQIGVIYPLCERGFRHVPVWADVLVRDPFSFKTLLGESGQLQLMNALSLGAPCHSVLTEDLGCIHPGLCPCGRSGPRFELLGRVPNAEVRGCGNV
jgi:hypothetical protein